MFWLVLSLIASVIWIFASASLAEQKGHSALLGGVLGFFLGGIGYLIIYLMPEADARARSSGPRLGPRAQRQMEIEAAIPPGGCRICRYVNSPGASRCYQCGNVLG